MSEVEGALILGVILLFKLHRIAVAIENLNRSEEEEEETDEVMDYRTLLKKYMKVVGHAEGVDFIPGEEDEASLHSITPEELAELQLLSEEVNEEWFAGEN